MGRRGDNIRKRNRRRMNSCGHQTGNVRHIHHQVSIYRFGNFTKCFKIKDARVSTRSGDNHLWPVFFSEADQFLIVNGSGIFSDTIMNKIVKLSRKTGRASVGQMSAVGQVHAENCISRIYQGKVNCHIGLGPRMGLNIDISGIEQFFGPADGQFFSHIHILTPAIIPLIRISFGIFVGQHTPLDSHDSGTRNIFRCDKLQGVFLPLKLAGNGFCNFRIRIFDEFERLQ